MFDLENEPKKPPAYEIGQELGEMSVEEIDETIARLEGEIARLQEMRDQKANHLSAAEALFKN